MRMSIVVSIACLFLVGCATAQPQSNWREDGYNRESARISALLDNGQIPRHEAKAQMLDAALLYYPKDELLITAWSQNLILAEKARKKQITEAKYKELNAALWTRYEAAAAGQYADMMAQADAQNRANTMGALAQGLSRSARSTYPQPVSCTSYQNGYSVQTNCY